MQSLIACKSCDYQQFEDNGVQTCPRCGTSKWYTLEKPPVTASEQAVGCLNNTCTNRERKRILICILIGIAFIILGFYLFFTEQDPDKRLGALLGMCVLGLLWFATAFRLLQRFIGCCNNQRGYRSLG